MATRQVKASDLKLADTVQLWQEQSWGTALVKQIKDGWITLFRPYGVTSDYSDSGGVFCYIGIEEFKVLADDYTVFTVVGKSKELLPAK